MFPVKSVVSWSRSWSRETAREVLCLVVATAVLVVAAPLGLTCAELASPALAASLAAVTFMSLSGGGRAALLLTCGVALSGAVWQGSLLLAVATGILLFAAAYLASARLLALEEERREVARLKRTRQSHVRRMEGDVERLSFDRPNVESTNRRRVQETGKVVTLLGFAKSVVRPGSRETKLLTLFDTLCEILPGGMVLLLVGTKEELRVVKSFPDDLSVKIGTMLPPRHHEVLASLQAGMAPLLFSTRIELFPGIEVTGGVAYSLSRGQVAVILVQSGNPVESATMDLAFDLLRTAGAAFSLADEVALRSPRQAGGGAHGLG